MFEGMTAAGLVFGLVFSTIGLVMFRRGKTDTDMVRLICGLLLLAYSYFLSNAYLIVGIGLLLAGTPFALEQGIPYLMSFWDKEA